MSIWNYLFDSEYAQRRDIEQLRSRVAEVPQDSHVHSEQLQSLRQQTFRQELVLEALVRSLEEAKLLDRSRLAKLIVQIDLEDGIEDGQMSQQIARKAPTCGACNKPINPKRAACVFCGAAIEKQEGASADGSSEPRSTTIRCGACFRKIPKSEADYSTGEPRCQECVRDK